MISEFVLSTYAGLATMAFLVSVLYWNLVITRILCCIKRNEKIFTDNFFLAFGIALGWTGTFLIRKWFWNWRFFRDFCPPETPDCTEWMLNSFWLVLFISFLIVGGAIHIRAVTKEKAGEMGWLLSVVAVVLVAFANWLFVH